MRLHSVPQVFFVAALAATAQAQQPVSGDPNNPNNQNNITPSIMNHGGGLDEGNLGPFPTPTDKQFAQLTEYRAMMEIRLGQMAVERGSAPGVKALGQRMVDDYTKWQGGLHRAAVRLELTLPTQLDSRRKAVVDHLASLTGNDFDQAYVKEMVNLQNKALTITQHEAANAGVSGFRNWAGLMMPTLEEHLQMTKRALTPASATK